MKVATQTVSNVHHFRPIGATYTAPVQETLDVSNAVAAELAGISDGVLDALKERLGASVRLRGNQLTLEGDDTQIAEARAVIDEIVELVEAGTQIGSHTVDAVLGTLAAGQGRARGLRRSRLAAPREEDRPENFDAEGVRRLDPARDRDLRHRPCGHGQDLSRDGARRRRAARARGRADHPHAPAVEAGERLGFLPGDLMAKGRPVPAPALRCALRHARPRQGEQPDRARDDRSARRSPSCAGVRLTTASSSSTTAQNTSPEQMQMFLTRLGFGSKVVVTGDVTQIDLPKENRSGLVHVRDVLQDIDGIQFIEFNHKDVVRHKLVQRIVEAYKDHTDERNR